MYAVAGTSSAGAILEPISPAPPPSPGSRDSPVLWSSCSAAVIAIVVARYRERSEHRHPDHFDIQRTDDELWNDEVTAPVAGGWALRDSNPRPQPCEGEVSTHSDRAPRKTTRKLGTNTASDDIGRTPPSNTFGARFGTRLKRPLSDF